jgi:7-carboxy-7-deazaguanine synthase
MKLREHYQVNEQFDTVQGEGVLVGTPATFIRLQGCTVGCPWCDTKYTWAAGGERRTVQEILSHVTHTHVVITGGEPTMYDLDGLLVPLQANKHYVQLETSGQNGIKGNVWPDWVTWSPKENLNWQAAFDIKDNASEVKWVVDENLEWDTVKDLFNWYMQRAGSSNQGRLFPHFVLMPEGCPPRIEMVKKTLEWLRMLDPWEERFFRYGDRIQYRIGVR